MSEPATTTTGSDPLQLPSPEQQDNQMEQQQQQQKKEEQLQNSTSTGAGSAKDLSPWKSFLARLVRIHREVVHPDHLKHSKHKEHIFHEHSEVSSEELFFDLIFVAIGIDLGYFLKADLTARRLGETLVIFATAWLTWFHTNILLTRFRLGQPLSSLVFLIMVGTLGHAIHAVEQPSVGVVESGFGKNDPMIFGSLCLTRVAFLCVYLVVAWRIPLARAMVRKYLIIFAISSCLFLAAAAANHATAAIVLWITASVAELIMYPLALLTPHEYQLTVNTAHLLERNQLWVVLILGESILSIASAQHMRDVEYYVVVVCAFLLVYWLMKFHLKSQHLLDERAEEHALDHSPLLAFVFDSLHLVITSGMLVMAVGIKLAISYASHPEDYKRVYAWALTGPLGITLFTMNVSSLLHKMRPLQLCGRKTTRVDILRVEAVLSLLIVPLALLVDENDTASKGKRSLADGGDDASMHFAPAPATTMDAAALAAAAAVGDGAGAGAYGDGGDGDYGLNAVPSMFMNAIAGGGGGVVTTVATAATNSTVDGDTVSHHLDPASLMPILACVLGSMLLLESLLTVEEEEEEDFFVSQGTQTDLTSFQFQADEADGHSRSRLRHALDVRRHRPHDQQQHHHHHDRHHYSWLHFLHLSRHDSRSNSPAGHDHPHHHRSSWLSFLHRGESHDASSDGGHDHHHHSWWRRRSRHASVDETSRRHDATTATSQPNIPESVNTFGNDPAAPVETPGLRTVTSVPSMAKLSMEGATHTSGNPRRRLARAPNLGSVAEDVDNAHLDTDAAAAAVVGGGGARRRKHKQQQLEASDVVVPHDGDHGHEYPQYHPHHHHQQAAALPHHLRPRRGPRRAESAPVSSLHTPTDGSRTPLAPLREATPVDFDSSELRSGLVLTLGGGDDDDDDDGQDGQDGQDGKGGGGGGYDGSAAAAGAATDDNKASEEMLEVAPHTHDHARAHADAGASGELTPLRTTSLLDMHGSMRAQPMQWTVREGQAGTLRTAGAHTHAHVRGRGGVDGAGDSSGTSQEQSITPSYRQHQQHQHHQQQQHVPTRGAATVGTTTPTHPSPLAERSRRVYKSTEAVGGDAQGGRDMHRGRRHTSHVHAGGGGDLRHTLSAGDVAHMRGARAVILPTPRKHHHHHHHSRRRTQLEREFGESSEAVDFFVVGDHEMRVLESAAPTVASSTTTLDGNGEGAGNGNGYAHAVNGGSDAATLSHVRVVTPTNGRPPAPAADTGAFVPLPAPQAQQHPATVNHSNGHVAVLTQPPNDVPATAPPEAPVASFPSTAPTATLPHVAAGDIASPPTGAVAAEGYATSTPMTGVGHWMAADHHTADEHGARDHQQQQQQPHQQPPQPQQQQQEQQQAVLVLSDRQHNTDNDGGEGVDFVVV